MRKKGTGRPWHFPAAIYYQIGDSIGDGVHPNHAGYEAYARRILTHLMGCKEA